MVLISYSKSMVQVYNHGNKELISCCQHLIWELQRQCSAGIMISTKTGTEVSELCYSHSYFMCLFPCTPATGGLTWFRIIFQGIYTHNSFLNLSVPYIKNIFFLLRARQMAKENQFCLKTCILPPNTRFIFPKLLKIKKKSTIF